MVKVLFKGPMKKSVGFEEMEIKGGNIEDVLRDLSRKLGVEIFINDGKAWMKLDSGGKKVKVTITIFHNGENILKKNVERIESGTLEIITPMGGG